MSLPTFRPRSATELVDAAVQLGRRHYAPLVTLSAIIAVPSLGLGLLAQWLLPQPTLTAELDPAALGAIFPALLAAMAWFYVGLGALVASAAAAYVDGHPLEPFDALRRALRRAVALILGNLFAAAFVVVLVLVAAFALVAIAGVIGAIVALLGGTLGAFSNAVALAIGALTMAVVIVGLLVFSALFVNVTAAVMLEQLGPFRSIARSARLVRGSLLRVSGVVAVMAALYLATYLTMYALAAVALDSQLAQNVAGVFVVVLYPFLAALLALLYYDLRIRREGYDIELLARALGEAPAEPPPAPPAVGAEGVTGQGLAGEGARP